MTKQNLDIKLVSNKLTIKNAALLGLLLGAWLSAASSAWADRGIPRPNPGPPGPLAPPAPPADAVPDVKLQKQVSAKLAAEGGQTTIRVPRRWLDAKDAINPAPPATKPVPAGILWMPASVAGVVLGALVIGGLALVGGRLRIREIRGIRGVNGMLLSVAGAVIVVMLAASVYGDAIGPRPAPRPALQPEQLAPGEMAGTIIVQVIEDGDEAELFLSKEIVTGLFAKAGQK